MLTCCFFAVIKGRGLPVVASVGTALMPGGQIAALPASNLMLMSRSFLQHSRMTYNVFGEMLNLSQLSTRIHR